MLDRQRHCGSFCREKYDDWKLLEQRVKELEKGLTLLSSPKWIVPRGTVVEPDTVGHKVEFGPSRPITWHAPKKRGAWWSVPTGPDTAKIIWVEEGECIHYRSKLGMPKKVSE